MKPLPVIQMHPQGGNGSSSAAPAASGMTSDPGRQRALMPDLVKALSTVFDPEIPVNIYDLGLVYDVIVDTGGNVGIRMTLTAPACPAAQYLPGQVQKAVEGVPGVASATVDVVWDPPWNRDRMSDAAKLQLGMF